MVFFLLLTIFIISVLFYWMSRIYLKDGYRLLNPINVLLVIWNLALFYHAILFGTDGNKSNLYILILIGLICFIIGFLFCARKEIVIKKTQRNGLNTYKDETIQYNEVRLQKVLLFTALCEIISICLSLYVIYKLTNGNLMLLFSNSTYVRLMYLTRNQGAIFNILSVVISIHGRLGYVVLGIYCAKKYRYYKKHLLLWVIMELVAAFITMSKMAFFIFLAIVSTAFVNSVGNLSLQKKTLHKIIPLVASVLLLLLVVIGTQRNYQTGNDTMLEFVLKRAGFYFASPVEALRLVVENSHSELGMGSNTFKILHKLLVRLNIVQDVSISNHLAAITTSYGDTNVYSWFYPFFQDLSYLGFAFFPFFVGMLSGFFYTSRETKFGRTAANSYIIAMVAMSFYEFLWTQGTYFYVLIYAFLFDSIFMRKVYN